MDPRHRDYIVACVVATEVPPRPVGTFTAAMIDLAIAAVCGVIRNRVASPKFPNTAVEVVLQKNQFSAVCREDYWRLAMAGIWSPAHVQHCFDLWCADHASIVPGALYYYSPISMEPKFSTPKWVAGLKEVPLVGMHRDYFRFYAEA